MPIQSRYFIITGIIISSCAAFAPLSLGVPTVYFPIPVYMLISMLAGISVLVGLAIFGLVLVMFQNKPQNTFQNRSLILNILLAVVSVFWFVYWGKYAFEYQGYAYYSVCLIQNILFNIIFWYCRYKSNQIKQQIYMLSMTVFLTGYAMPYFGEIP